MKTSGLELDIAVEIEGHSSYRDLSSIIEPGSEAHKVCLEIEEVVYEQVKKSCPLWTSISYHLRGPSSIWPHGERKPTLMMGVPPGTRNNWCKVEELGIEILPGSPELLDQAQIEESFAWKDRYLNNRHLVGPRWQGDFDGEPKNSSSIGARGSKIGSGTLGVWVYFQAAGSTEKQLCFITTYDVVADGDLENKGSNDEFGIGLDGLPILRDIIIDFPAPLDLADTKKEDQEDVEVGVNFAEVSEKVLKLMDEIAASGGIGQVIHASGVRKNSQDHRMNWALVKIRDQNVRLHSLFPSIFLPSAAQHILTTTQLLPENKPPPAGCRGGINAEHPYVYYDPKPDDKITKISPLGQGTWVIKDQAGFIPRGQVNAMYSRAKLADGSETREWEVMCLPRDGSGMYVERGEGGAMLVNRKLEWVGMVWGSSGIGGGALVMDAGEILEDVEARTGGTVSLV